MRTSLHAVFDDDTRAHDALATLKAEGLADPCADHLCTYDRLDHSPGFTRSAAPMYAVVGSVAFAHLGALIGLVLVWTGLSELGAGSSAALGALAGASGGALTSLLAGSGATRPDLARAGRFLRPGRLILSFAPGVGTDPDRVARRVRQLGALAVERGVPGAI